MNIISSDNYIWLVEYADGTHLPEYDSDRPDGRGWLEVKQEDVKTVFLLDPDPTIATSHRVLIPEGAMPVFFRRRLISLSGNERRGTAHCIGWKRGDESVYLFVFEDGSSVMTTDLQAI